MTKRVTARNAKEAAKDCPKCQLVGAYQMGLECPDWTPPAPKLTTKKRAELEAKESLLKILTPGQRVYGIVRTVSRSGMSRTIDFYTFVRRDGAVGHNIRDANDFDRVYLSGYFATLLDYRRTDQGALKVQGCGMDMIFSVVYSVGRMLWPEGFGLPCTSCGTVSGPLVWQEGYRPKTREEAEEMLSAKAEFPGRNGERSGWEEDGGYALKAEQL